MTPTARLAPPSVSTFRSRVLLVTLREIPNSNSPLRKRVSVLTSEQQCVDLGGLSHAKVMISAASTISLPLITTVW